MRATVLTSLVAIALGGCSSGEVVCGSNAIPALFSVVDQDREGPCSRPSSFHTCIIRSGSPTMPEYLFCLEKDGELFFVDGPEYNPPIPGSRECTSAQLRRAASARRPCAVECDLSESRVEFQAFDPEAGCLRPSGTYACVDPGFWPGSVCRSRLGQLFFLGFADPDPLPPDSVACTAEEEQQVASARSCFAPDAGP